jgi:hypothetical protein
LEELHKLRRQRLRLLSQRLLLNQQKKMHLPPSLVEAATAPRHFYPNF